MRFCLHDGRFDEIVAFDLDDEPRIIFELDEKIRIIPLDRVRFRVNVLNEKVRLPVREHSRKINFFYFFVSQQIKKQSVFGIRVEAISVEVKTFRCEYADRSVI